MEFETHPIHHGLMPARNPILGTFKHAPCARNASSKYFRGNLITFEEYLKSKALRHNPFTGQFHTGPQRYSNLHNLRRFRSASNGKAGRSQPALNVEISHSRKNGSFASVETTSSTASSLPWLESPLSADVAEFGLGQSSSRGSFDAVDKITPNSEKTFGDLQIPEVFRSRTISYSQTSGLLFESQNWWDVTEEQRGERAPNSMVKKRHASSDDLPTTGAQNTAVENMLLSDSSDLSDESQEELYSSSPIDSEDQFLTRDCVTRSNSDHMLVENRKETHRSERRPQRGESVNNLAECSNISSYDAFIDYTNLDESAGDPAHDAGNRWIINHSTVVTEKYKLDMTKGGSLGKGAYSLVKCATHRKSQQEFAIKIVRKRLLVAKEEREMIKREVEIHQVLIHPNIVRLHEIFEDSKRLFLVLEKTDSGDLEHFLGKRGGRLPEPQCQYAVKQILEAVHYLHSNGCLQGDMKPSNILLQRKSDGEEHNPDSILSYQLKLCDFGLSRKVPDIKFFKHTGDVHKVPYTSLCGTMGYVAPELLRKESYTIAADVWSVGIMTYEMLSGTKPFVHYRDCVSVPLDFPAVVFGRISSAAIELVKKMLELDVSLRISSGQALEDLWLISAVQCE